jgi:large subunit ribosomal protein L28
MAKCAICEKTKSFGNKISIARSHVSRRSTRTFKPNLRTVTVDVNGESKKVCVCSKFLRNLKNA